MNEVRRSTLQVEGNAQNFVPRQRRTAMNRCCQKTLIASLAALVYFGINLLAIQYMDERNGVFDGNLSPHGNHWPVAQQIMHGEALTNFRYPPGFSIYLIAAVKAAELWGGSYFFWRLMQDCLSTVVTSLLITTLMSRFIDSAWVIWGANILLIYNLTYTAGTASDLVMASFLPWFYGGLLLLIQSLQDGSKKQAAHAFLAGILLALSGFIRPDILLFLPFLTLVFPLAIFLQRIRLIQRFPAASSNLACFSHALLGFGVILVPWIVFSSMRSRSLVVYSTGFVFSHIDGMSRFPGNPVSEAFRMLLLNLSPVALFRIKLVDVISMHYRLINQYPWDWIVLWLQKIWHPWYASDSERWNVILLMQTLLILPAVLSGSCLWWKTRGLDLAFIIALSTIIYFWLVSLAVLSINRYMPPVYPFLGMFAGLAIELRWPRRFSDGSFNLTAEHGR